MGERGKGKRCWEKGIVDLYSWVLRVVGEGGGIVCIKYVA